MIVYTWTEHCGYWEGKNTQREPGSRVVFPANLMNIMTAWLLWCDVGTLTTDDPISWEKLPVAPFLLSYFKFTFHIVFSVFHSLSSVSFFTFTFLFLLSLISFAFAVFIWLVFSWFPFNTLYYPVLWTDNVNSKVQWISVIISLLFIYFLSYIIIPQTGFTCFGNNYLWVIIIFGFLCFSAANMG